MKLPWFHREPKPPRRGVLHFCRRHLPGLTVIILFLAMTGFVLFPFMLITVPSGQAGVLWKRFSGPGFYCLCFVPSGTVLDPAEVRNEGLHIVWPWDKLFFYDMRLQISTQKFNAISHEGVSVTAEVTLRYQLDFNWVAVLHQFIGPNYLKTALTPSIASVTRAVISKYSAAEVYSTRRDQVEIEIRNAAIAVLRQHLDKLFQASASDQHDLAKYQTSLQNSIQIIDTLVLSIELPTDIVSAINRKTEQFYLIQEYQYRVEREVEEARRKQVEANGISAFQRTVSEGISDSFLRWQGIQATLALAQSKNSKIVVIGSGKDGLPIILGNVDTPATPANATQTDKTDKTDKTTADKPSDQTPEARRSKPVDLSSLESLLGRINDALRGSDKDKAANNDKDKTTGSDNDKKTDKTSDKSDAK